MNFIYEKNPLYENLNLKEKAYHIIKNKIINCEIPPGASLNEKELKDEIGASRTPIREALNKLEQENLIKIKPKRGIFVNDITMKDIRDIFMIRKFMEPYIMKLSIKNIKKDELIKFKKLFEEFYTDRKDDIYYTKLDARFHYFLIKASDNKYLINMMQQIFIQNHRIRILSAKKDHRLEDSIEEHLNIINLMLDSKIEKAASKMEEHLQKSWEVASQLGINMDINI
jgi:DNA-binding GntR family transcriptional regulator